MTEPQNVPMTAQARIAHAMGLPDLSGDEPYTLQERRHYSAMGGGVSAVQVEERAHIVNGESYPSLYATKIAEVEGWELTRAMRLASEMDYWLAPPVAGDAVPPRQQVFTTKPELLEQFESVIARMEAAITSIAEVIAPIDAVRELLPHPESYDPKSEDPQLAEAYQLRFDAMTDLGADLDMFEGDVATVREAAQTAYDDICTQVSEESAQEAARRRATIGATLTQARTRLDARRAGRSRGGDTSNA